MVKGKTESGFEFEIKDEALDDYELLEALHKADRGEIGYMTEVVTHLLGPQADDLKKHVAETYGRISMQAMFKEVTQIFNSNNEIKN